MQITYELGAKDFLEAYGAHRNRTALSRWSRRFLLAFLVVVVSILLSASVVQHGRLRTVDLLQLLGVAALWFVLLWGLPRWSVRRQFLKQPGAKGPRTLVLDIAGAHWRWNGGTGDVEWRNYIRWVEGKNQILFYTSPAYFNILPKRALRPEELDQLRSFLKQNIAVTK